MPHVSPLPSVDLVHAVAFWARFTTTNSELGFPMPTVVAPFGDSVDLANELVGLIGSGLKRATAGAMLDYERAGDPLPVVGAVSIATDGTGQEGGVPVKDIDFTNPTFPNGTLRPDHSVPEQHPWIPNDPANPKAGHKRGPGEPLEWP